MGTTTVRGMWATRATVAGVLLALGLSACGGAATDAGDGGTETRTVEHDMGSTDVPAEPERVVVLDSPHLDAALSLGVTPVGSVQSAVDAGLPGYLGERTEGIEVVGTITEPNLEAIAGLDPDLIISATVRHEAIYGELSTIAPTVFSASSGTSWPEQVELVGEALGLADEAAAQLDDFDQRAQAVGEAIGAEGRTASIVRFLPGEIRLYGPETFSGSVLTQVGFDLGDHPWNEYSMYLVSAEEITQADADVVFATTYGPQEDTERPAVAGVWDTLSAVAEGRQHDVDDRVWMVGIGLIGGNLILDDLEQLVSP